MINAPTLGAFVLKHVTIWFCVNFSGVSQLNFIREDDSL